MICKYCGDKLKGAKKQCKKWDKWFHHNHLTHLGSDKWQGIKDLLFKERGKKCEKCGWAFDLEVHHLNYCRLGDERPSDLMVLCDECHGKTHGR